MGSYTQFQKLYLTDPDELVDAETNLNYNWRKLDDSVKHLVGWAPTDTDYITGNEDLSNGRKYLKRQSNSTWLTWNNVVGQDPFAYVEDWTVIPDSAFNPGWSNWVDFGRAMYSIGDDGMTTLRGMVRLNDGATEFIPKTSYNILTLPSEAIPTQNRWAFTHMGVAPSSQYAICRLVIATNGIVQMVRYGGAQSSSSERYVSLNGISYVMDVGT